MTTNPAITEPKRRVALTAYRHVGLVSKHTMHTPEMRVEVFGLIGMGLLLLAVAVFGDPIGSSPDTGLIDLGHQNTKWLLGVLGGCFLAAGLAVFIRTRSLK